MEPQKWICWAAFLVILLEVGFFLWIGPMVRVLARSASATATRRWGANFAIGTLRMLLFDVCVESRVTQISLRTVAAFEVPALYVILRPTLAFASAIVLVAPIIVPVIPAVRLLTTSTHVLDLPLAIIA